MSSQMWEKAIELGKQLAKMHESHMFDFMELSQLLVRGRVHSACNSAVQRKYQHSFINYYELEWSCLYCYCLIKAVNITLMSYSE